MLFMLAVITPLCKIINYVKVIKCNCNYAKKMLYDKVIFCCDFYYLLFYFSDIALNGRVIWLLTHAHSFNIMDITVENLGKVNNRKILHLVIMFCLGFSSVSDQSLFWRQKLPYVDVSSLKHFADFVVFPGHVSF